MCTVVDDTVHIEVKAVELRYPALCDQRRDSWIPFAEPAKEFRDTHCERLVEEWVGRLS